MTFMTDSLGIHVGARELHMQEKSTKDRRQTESSRCHAGKSDSRATEPVCDLKELDEP